MTCELGDLYLQIAQDGPVDVLIRPENVQVRPGPPTSDFRVQDIRFFGHDQLVNVRTPAGNIVSTRLGPMYNFAVGQPVDIQVTGLVMAYARRPAAG